MHFADWQQLKQVVGSESVGFDRCRVPFERFFSALPLLPLRKRDSGANSNFLLSVFVVSVVLLLSGCVSPPKTTWLDWRGGVTSSTGKGGVVRQVEGIDYWTSGEPDRPFKVMGIMEQAFAKTSYHTDVHEADFVKYAQEHGADAVIVLKNTIHRRSIQVTPGGIWSTYNWSTADHKIVAAAVKYLP